MALRVCEHGGKNDRSRINYAFELCTGHQPDPREIATISSLLNDENNLFETNTVHAIKVASHDPDSPPKTST